MAKVLTSKSRRDAADEGVMVPVDKQTAHELQRLSEATHFSPQEMARWLTWLGRKAMGRQLSIQEGNKVLKISLEDYQKLSDKLDLN